MITWIKANKGKATALAAAITAAASALGYKLPDWWPVLVQALGLGVQ